MNFQKGNSTYTPKTPSWIPPVTPGVTPEPTSNSAVFPVSVLFHCSLVYILQLSIILGRSSYTVSMGWRGSIIKAS